MTVKSSCCIVPFIIMKCPSLCLVTFSILKSVSSDISMATPTGLRYHFLECQISPFSLWVYICPCSSDVSLGGSIWLGLVFLSNVLFCAFFRGSSVHLHLEWLLIYKDFLSFCFVFWWLCVSIVSFPFCSCLLFLCGGIQWFSPSISFCFMLCISVLDFFWVVTIKFMKRKFHFTVVLFPEHSSYLHSPFQVQTFTLFRFMFSLSQIIHPYGVCWFLSCSSKLFLFSFFFF